MTTRDAFLARVAGQVRRGRPNVAPAAAPGPPPAEAAEAVRRQMAERWREALERFQQEFERVAGVFHRSPRSAVADVVLGIAREHGVSRIVAWDASALGVDVAPALATAGLDVSLAGASDDALARQRHRDAAAAAGLGVTGADLAIAETGTLVLRSGGLRPRATSLLPPIHVAVFDRSHLVESLDHLGIALEAWHADPSSAPGAMINLITGPSRTADIELTLTRGVHGPKHVHAVFVEPA